MNKDFFLSKIIGVHWKDRSCSFDSMDCWGLVVLYYRHVKGIELHDLPGYESGDDFITCHENLSEIWSQSSVEVNDCLVTFYHGDNPVHVGLIISPGKVLHSRGECGTVRIDSLLVLKRMYSDVRFMTYAKI